MPVKIKGTKALKASKENACVKHKQKINTGSKLGHRKVLGDKTNSASGDDASVLNCETLPPKTVPIKKTAKECKPINTETNERPRRARRVPNRFIENNGDKVLSKKSKSPSPVKTNIVSSKHKAPVVVSPPLKTPHKTHDSSLIVNRTKRICRLPSKFNDSSTSPSKYFSVQPINSSTPLAPKASSVKQGKRELRSKTVSEKNIQPKRNATKDRNKKNNEVQTTQKSPKQSQITSFLKKKLPDTNNNAKSYKNISIKTSQKSPDKRAKNSNTERNKIKDLDFSVKILDDRKSLKRNSNKADIYEFTFDPSEEPPPAKKAKKKHVTRKPSKPRKVTYKSNYEKNLAKALAALKNTVAPDKVVKQNDKKATNKVPSNKNPDLNEVAPGHDINDKNQILNEQNDKNQILNQQNDKNQILNQQNDKNLILNQQNDKNLILNQQNDKNQIMNHDIETRDYENADKNYNSIRVEDIAMDIQPDADINYTPITPSRPKTSKSIVPNTSNVNDPLNLQEELSFFDDQPAASSSMNQSIRHPTASPWRIEFGNLPIKWQVNTYVKPNMTPALESSFINFNDSKKKHVYTPMVPVHDSIHEVVESPNLKQTSIMSFIKEVVERSANKKRKKSSPVKNNSLFEDVTHSFVNIENRTTKETSKSSKSVATPNKSVLIDNTANDINNDSSVEDKENESESNEKSNENEKNLTYFGFDESEDQENARPIRKKLRSTKSHNRRALQELNTFKGPIRPVLPVAAKTKILQNIDKANEAYENMKSTAEPPVIPDISIAGNIEVTNVIQTEDNEDSQSVHLFEDIEIVHHKPIRKSYSKPKRVMFKQKVVDSDDNDSDEENHEISSEGGMDESFTLPTVQQKKPTKRRATKKQKLSKKEQKEVEAWAAGFNSMCEDIEEFDLVVE